MGMPWTMLHFLLKFSRGVGFQQCGMCDQQSLRSFFFTGIFPGSLAIVSQTPR